MLESLNYLNFMSNYVINNRRFILKKSNHWHICHILEANLNHIFLDFSSQNAGYIRGLFGGPFLGHLLITSYLI